jgi:hypothetical protein
MGMAYYFTGRRIETRTNNPSPQFPVNLFTSLLSPPAGSWPNCVPLVGRLLMALLLGGPVFVSAQGALTNGWTHTGTIAPAGEVDSWTFSSSVGDHIVFRLGKISQTNSLTLRIRLITPAGNQQATASGVSATELSVVATNSGTFTAMIDGTAVNATGEYRLTLAKLPGTFTVAPGDQGGPLTNGVVHTGFIDVGDVDVWTFSANVGDNIVVRMAEASPGSALTPSLSLYGPNGALLDFFGSSTAASQVAVRATNSGTFTVVAGDQSAGFAGSGAYRLNLAKTGDPIVISPGDEGGPLTNGWTHTGTIEVGDMDLWSFTANAGDSIQVRVGETGGTGLTPYLGLYGPTGALLDSSAIAGTADVSFRATNSGTFLVLVTDLSGAFAGSGSYRLTLAKTGSPIMTSPGDEGGPLTNGVIHTGFIDVGDLDTWSFTANAGDSIALRMGELTNASPLTPAMWLYGPTGALLDSSSGSAAAQVSFRATNSGTFTLVAGDFSGAFAGSGAYRLTLAKTGDPLVLSAGDEGGPLTNGVTHTGTLYVADLDVWFFSANAGDTLTVRVGKTAGSLFTPALWLYGPTGALLDSTSGSGAAEVSVRATTNGTFTVVVGDFSGGYAGSGSYRLTLARTGSPIVISPGDEGGPLTNGVMHTGTIDLGDLDVWSFTAMAGENIVVRMGEMVAGSSLTPVLWLYGPTGALLDSFAGSTVAAEVGFRATNSGTFIVVAGDFSGGYAGTGPYRLTLAKTGSPVEVSPGDEGGRLNGSDVYEGMLDPGDLDVWSFTLCAGDIIALRLEELTPGSGLAPWLRLYGRDGTLQRSVSGVSNVQFSVAATNNGTFTVVAGDFSGGYAGSGPYRLTVNGLSHDMRLCVPRVSGNNVTLSGVGGVTGTDFTVITSPLVEAPLATWTPLFTNQFDLYGTFTRSNAYPRNEPRRFFILRRP